LSLGHWPRPSFGRPTGCGGGTLSGHPVGSRRPTVPGPVRREGSSRRWPLSPAGCQKAARKRHRCCNRARGAGRRSRSRGGRPAVRAGDRDRAGLRARTERPVQVIAAERLAPWRLFERRGIHDKSRRADDCGAHRFQGEDRLVALIAGNCRQVPRGLPGPALPGCTWMLWGRRPCRPPPPLLHKLDQAERRAASRSTEGSGQGVQPGERCSAQHDSAAPPEAVLPGPGSGPAVRGPSGWFVAV